MSLTSGALYPSIPEGMRSRQDVGHGGAQPSLAEEEGAGRTELAFLPASGAGAGGVNG